MKDWQLRELEIKKRENAWYESLSPFMKAVDNHTMFCFMLIVSWIVATGLGLLIGVML